MIGLFCPRAPWRRGGAPTAARTPAGRAPGGRRRSSRCRSRGSSSPPVQKQHIMSPSDAETDASKRNDRDNPKTPSLRIPTDAEKQRYSRLRATRPEVEALYVYIYIYIYYVYVCIYIYMYIYIYT